MLAAIVAVLIGLASSGVMTSGVLGTLAGPKPLATSTPPPFPDAYKMNRGEPAANVPGVVSTSPNGFSHPCMSQMVPDPPFAGLSPIAIAYPRATCTSQVNMGDIATWQYGGHDYVGLSGFGGRMYFIYNVDDPYNPVLQKEESFPTGGTASLSIFDWKQNGNQYMSVTMRGSGTGCGWFAYNVNNPTAPVQVASVRNSPDWCTVHEHFVSLDANGNADYAWFTMSGESGSEGKIIAMDIRDLSNIHEVNRWDRDGDSGYFIHDSNVVRGRLYAAHWDGGMYMFDEAAFVSGVPPVPLNPLGSIQPSGFRIHHVVPTSDDKYVLVQDEFINSPSLGKIKMYDIQNVANPQFVTEIIGGDSIANNQQAHNMIIKPLGPGIDLLLDAWYKAGTRGNLIDTNQNPPTITQKFRHQLNLNQTPAFGNVWGVDWLPCTLRGLQRTCIYSGDMTFGLVVDAVNTDTFTPDPTLDPYNPEVPVITSPAPGPLPNTCSITISGTAHDYWSGLQRVEVSTDGGGSWHTATGTTSWSYDWSITGSGSRTIKARAFDMANNVANSLDLIVDITASCPLTTPTPMPSWTPLPTNTNTVVVNTPTRTSTSVPNTPIPTNTTAAPTNTATPPSPVIEPTDTPVPATNTPESPVPTATDTAEPPAATATDTPEPPAPTATDTTEPPAPTATATACTITFTDVSNRDWFYPYVYCLYCHGVIGGYPDNTFRPSNSITRGQIAKIIAISAGFDDTVSGQSFEDVAPTSTFYTWVEQLYMHDAISGYDCGGTGEPCGTASLPYFRPNNTATRGQMAKVIVIAADMPSNTTGGPHFSDVGSGSTFYDYVETMFNAGAITGYSDGTFHPSSNVTRAQASKMAALVFFPECATR